MPALLKEIEVIIFYFIHGLQSWPAIYCMQVIANHEFFCITDKPANYEFIVASVFFPRSFLN